MCLNGQANVLLLPNHKKSKFLQRAKNDEKRSCSTNAEEDGVGGQGHRGKKPTSTNVVTLIDP